MSLLLLFPRAAEAVRTLSPVYVDTVPGLPAPGIGLASFWMDPSQVDLVSWAPQYPDSLEFTRRHLDASFLSFVDEDTQSALSWLAQYPDGPRPVNYLGGEIVLVVPVFPMKPGESVIQGRMVGSRHGRR